MLTRNSINSRLNDFSLSSDIFKLEQIQVSIKSIPIMQAAESGSGSPVSIRVVAHHAEPCISPHVSSDQNDRIEVDLLYAKVARKVAHLEQTGLPKCSRTCIVRTNDISTN